MRSVIGHEASLLYNLTGAKGKLPFSELVQLNKVINVSMLILTIWPSERNHVNYTMCVPSQLCSIASKLLIK